MTCEVNIHFVVCISISILWLLLLYTCVENSARVTNALFVSFLGENKEWRNFVNIRIYQWSKMLRYWLVNSTRPVLIVKYEDMKQDPVLQVKRILHFINYHHLTDEELKIKLKDGFK